MFGSVFAHEAKAKGKSVLVIDKRENVGGNIYTENVEGINVNRFKIESVYGTGAKQIKAPY